MACRHRTWLANMCVCGNARRLLGVDGHDENLRTCQQRLHVTVCLVQSVELMGNYLQAGHRLFGYYLLAGCSWLAKRFPLWMLK